MWDSINRSINLHVKQGDSRCKQCWVVLLLPGKEWVQEWNHLFVRLQIAGQLIDQVMLRSNVEKGCKSIDWNQSEILWMIYLLTRRCRRNAVHGESMMWTVRKETISRKTLKSISGRSTRVWECDRQKANSAGESEQTDGQTDRQSQQKKKWVKDTMNWGEKKQTDGCQRVGKEQLIRGPTQSTTSDRVASWFHTQKSERRLKTDLGPTIDGLLLWTFQVTIELEKKRRKSSRESKGQASVQQTLPSFLTARLFECQRLRSDQGTKKTLLFAGFRVKCGLKLKCVNEGGRAWAGTIASQLLLYAPIGKLSCWCVFWKTEGGENWGERESMDRSFD